MFKARSRSRAAGHTPGELSALGDYIMNTEVTKAGKTILVLDGAECRAALVGLVFGSAKAANAHLKRAACAVGAYAPYITVQQLQIWGAMPPGAPGRSPAQIAAAKNWGAACAEGRRKKKEQGA